MPVFRTDKNQIFDTDGSLISESVVQVDITAQVNGDTIKTRAAAALAANNTFLTIASPTNAQAVAQVQKLTREMNGLIRFLLDDFDDVSDT